MKMVIEKDFENLEVLFFRGDEGIRTLDPLLARQVLSQLSYVPICSVIYRAANGNRTRDLHLTKVTLYRLSHSSRVFVTDLIMILQ